MELDAKIPNNVNLTTDPKLRRALEKWQPHFIDWWMEMGPEGFQQDEVYLRTAVSVEPSGWAHYDYVKMPDYRWGIFLAPGEPDRRIGFGDNEGQPAWQEVPGEFRTQLRRLIVTQGDTEPASVEQQRHLGRTAPSIYDLRNLFQVNVEEGRHLWAMVYLLHSYFGRDGREEAEELLERRSGDADKPRILGAFNEPCDDWLNFYMFTMFTDRDGKYQLLALAESGLDPLSRTTKFMLTEEAFHMSVGETGVGRVVERTAQLMREHKDDDVRKHGGIDLPTIQKYLNFWLSASTDLFGGEISSNAAQYFAAGLKGRNREEGYSDHKALEGVYHMVVPKGGKLVNEEIPLRNAMNEILRDDYIADCQRGVERWNKLLEEAGLSDRLSLPSRRFNRQIGIYSGMRFDPAGELITEETWNRQRDEWLPTKEDQEFVRGLMHPVEEPRQIAGWIAPPVKGIKGRPVEFQYVRRTH
ncbi:MAG TPA: benzoyl-CoA 2,3-epoxidase subunit BoxB [Vicinamibacteria bacterium]|nr:benzoyl-CoA 2,3-epoxidase subunit BoxB [Vicinamibacteria bacterium]